VLVEQYQSPVTLNYTTGKAPPFLLPAHVLLTCHRPIYCRCRGNAVVFLYKKRK